MDIKSKTSAGMAQLDKETVENFLMMLSKAKFDGICRILLSDYFRLDPVNVDRRGDGGGDWVTIPYKGGKRVFIAQATIQDDNWKSKCLIDAQKAVDNFQCTRYLFLTSRRRDSVDLLDLENTISEEHDIPANCLGAVEIADILVSRKIVARAFHEAGIPISISDNDRLDRKEMLIFGALSIGANATALRDRVYDDAVLCAISSNGALSREKLVQATVAMLQCGDHREDRIISRLDSLLSRGVLIQDSRSKEISTSSETGEALSLARSIYLEQFADLKAKIHPAFEKRGLVLPSDSDLSRLTIFSSRATILRSLRGTQDAGIDFPNSSFLDQFGDPYSDTRSLIKEATNLHTWASVDELFSEITDSVASHPLVLRLSHEVLFFALDGVSPIHQAKALGIGSWEQAEAILDASVAIPFLCSKIAGPSTGRFSRGAIAGISALQRVGCRTIIPRDYLNEAAVHLLHAIDYCRPFPDESLLTSSPNGYVSHYFRLKLDSRDVPQSLLKFLLILSPSLKNPDSADIVHRVMNDLQARFSDLGVSKVDFAGIPDAQISMAAEAYAAERSKYGSHRDSILVEHDVRTIAWMRKNRAMGRPNEICLTWDKILIGVSRSTEDTGWVVTPHQISDIITMGSRRDESALMTATHDLAAARSLEDDLVGRLLDEAIGHAKAGRIEWKVIEELSELRKQLHSRAFSDGEPSDQQLNEYSEEFWKRQGIDSKKSHPRARITGEDIKVAFEHAHLEP